MSNNGELENMGLLELTGLLQNNGRLRQDSVGLLTGRDFGNDASVSGFGSYRFTGRTVTQGSFVGDSPSAPIVFTDTSPTGQVFDEQRGTVENVVRGQVTRRSRFFTPADCGKPPAPAADLIVTKTGPATVDAGGTVTYTVTASNAGPGGAADRAAWLRVPG